MNKRYLLLLSSGQQYPYEVIASQRAKYLRIKLSNTGELSVVLPAKVHVNNAHDFVNSKIKWIESNLDKLILDSQIHFPKSIELVLINENWAVKYVELAVSGVELTELSESSLVIQGNTKDKQLVTKLINKWCQKKAKNIFTLMLESLAEEHGFHFNRMTVRSQKTRWGSCSNSKNISLNSKLILMPETVVKYVIIHELCHTIEMNHSKQFWSLVEECDPDYQDHRKTLRLLGKKLFL